MENKINIADLLRDCPSGMELDCSVFEDVTLYRIDTDTENEYPIRIKTKNDYFLDLTKYGTYSNVEEAKCLIFPKGKTTWEGFQRPFKDGDILFYKHKSNNVKYTFIYKRRIDMHYLLQYCGWFLEKPYLSEQFNAKERMPLYENDDIRFATEEEKLKLFKAIKDNGYKWNSEAKTLEKLFNFKVGDTIRHKTNKVYCELGEYSEGISAYRTNIGLSLTNKDLEQWELAPNKFNINTLKPFDKVLVRDYDNKVWKTQFFERLNNRLKDKFICMGGNRYHQCVPYEGNEYLLNYSNKPKDFYINWE